ncbi:MAG: molybdopterin-dependent oxidoreductase [Deltaproteobacteria bacterium]|nr:molybdopterin-dependent oxidoreductase [Deltaproteobacteria bacterium]
MKMTADSVCPLDCPDTCSLSVTLEDGRITAIDGSGRNPLTDGFICAKVRRYHERVYSPLRLLYPQRRVGAKGEGRFTRISWDEAIALIAERFKHIVAEDGAEAILPYHYGGSNGVFGDNGADARFFNRLGASELLKTLCAAPTGAVYRAMYGNMGGVPPEDYRLARCIILWGVNPSATSIHLVPHLNAARRAGAFVAVIDPRRTPPARRADLHLPLLPGTDAVLALALINELVRSHRVDRAFIDQHVNGFEELARAAAAYPLARAAEICQVPEQDIAALADAFSAASPAVIRCGWGVERTRNAGNAVRAIFALPAVAGKFGVRGGGLTMSLSRPYPVNGAALARADLRPHPVREINMSQLGRVLTEPLAPPVRALFVYNANPVAMTPNQNLVVRGLQREDLFTVVHEQVLTDTARFADVLLPATTVFETSELHKSYGHFYLQYSSPVIAPVGESLSNPELFARLACAMGFEEPACRATTDELLAAAMDFDHSRIGGMSTEQLRREKVAALHFNQGTELVQFATTHPTTPSGKIELCPPELGPPAYAPLPATHPLICISPATDKTINSTFGEFNLPAGKLTMHPADAQLRGLGNGDRVRVFNDLGEVQVTLIVSHEVRPGVVSLPKGLWCASTFNGATAAALAPDHVTDIAGGGCYNDARVEVAAVG